MKTNSSHNPSKSNLIVLGSLLGVTIVSGAVLRTAMVKADVDDEITITVSESCTMTGEVTDAHTETIANGQYDSTIGETAINVTCNDNAGFAVYAIGYTGNTLGNNVLTSTTLGNSHDIETGTQTSGNDSQWAMKLGPDTAATPSYPLIIAGSSADGAKETGDPDFSSFQEVPDDYTKVAYRTAATDVGTNAEGSNFTTTYQAYISSTQAAGTYQGKVKYVLVHPNTAPAPVRPISFNEAYTNAGKIKLNGYYKMQDATSAICNAVTEGEVGELIDTRDNGVYTVAKLADGKCWMTKNLDLAGGTALSADDTDVTSTYIDNFSTSNNLTKADNKIVLPEANTASTYDANYSYIYNSNSTTCGNQLPCYSYYSWDAATLGSGRSISTGNTDAEQSICPKGWKLPTSRTNSAANWQTTSDFYALAHQYGLNSTTATYEYDHDFYNLAGPGTIPNFRLGGFYGNATHADGGTYGYYWSSTSYSDDQNAFFLRFYESSFSGYVDTTYYRQRYFSYSVRCLVK